MNDKIPTIETARLILRPFSAQDAQPLHKILWVKDMLRYFPSTNPPDIEGVQRMIARHLAHWDEHGYGWWAVQPRDESELIGWSGLTYLPETDETEIAYLLARPYWGQGLATEASQVGMEYGFNQLGLDTIIGITHPENLASQRVLEKLGLHFVERTRYFGMDCFRYIMECDRTDK
jgi:ribosomal-protein-alanine N-acetyltransferase